MKWHVIVVVVFAAAVALVLLIVLVLVDEAVIVVDAVAVVAGGALVVAPEFDVCSFVVRAKLLLKENPRKKVLTHATFYKWHMTTAKCKQS